ncbi:MAG TPA: CotH kinase family protein [Prolixibacteraceae bacterium]|nr:CotH kinase family protein [Prolixibacteraceae bacterium]
MERIEAHTQKQRFNTAIALIIIAVFIGNIRCYADEFKYFVQKTEPTDGWQLKGFNDSLWGNGSVSIHYGEDTTYGISVDTTNTFYLRYPLKVSQALVNKKCPLVIYPFFDDGFIAYLNGVEILRINIADSIKKPNNLTTTNRSHEQTSNIGSRPVYGYYIDTLQLTACQLDTSNILSFEVHNDTIGGSDLFFELFDYQFLNKNFSYNLYDYPSRFTAPVKLDSLPFPIMVIETDEYGCRSAGTIATMGIINNGEGKYNKLTNRYTDYHGRINLKFHGQTSKDYPKSPYKIELQDSLGNNNNVSLLGMPPENDWVLIAPFYDKSLLRNYFVYSLGRKMGHYEPRIKPCEVIINGRDVGLYMLTEQIKRDKNRVDIKKLEPKDNSEIDLTGGYLFRYDKDMTELEILYPKEDEITAQQSDYIHNVFDEWETALISSNFKDPGSGYRNYIDTESLIDYMIINELTGNIDAYFYSFYMYKDRDDVDRHIQFGPLWDYEFSLGYSQWQDLPTSNWMFDSRTRIDIPRMLQDSTFATQLARKWHSYRKGILHTDTLNQYINELVDSFTPEIEWNYKIWPIFQYKYTNGTKKNVGTTYPEEIEKWQTWMEKRMTWIDNNIDAIRRYPAGTSIVKNCNISATLYPNPFSEHLILSVTTDETATIRIEVNDLCGRTCFETTNTVNSNEHQAIHLNLPATLEKGIYFVSIFKNNGLVSNQKIMKF